MKPPIKEKYIDEHFKPLFIYGTSSTNEVDLENCDGTVISLPSDVAEKVIAANKKYMTELYQLLGFKDLNHKLE